MSARPLPILSAALAVLFVACGDSPSTGPSMPMNVVTSNSIFPPTCGASVQIPLLAGQDLPVGSVLVGNDGTNLYVRYEVEASSGWELTQAHLAVDEIPTNGAGNPQIGRFPQGMKFDPPRTSWMFTVPLSDHGLEPGDVTPMAAQARVSHPELGEETAWADGILLNDRARGGSWATWFEYSIADCGSSTSIDPSVGGSVASADGNATLEIEADALEGSEPVVITVESVPSPIPEALPGTVYDFGPDGTTFDPPAFLEVEYDDTGLSPAEEAALRLVVFDAATNTYEVVEGSSVDTDLDVLSGFLSHFSIVGGATADNDVEAGLHVAPVPAATGTPFTHTVEIANPGPQEITDVDFELRVQGEVFFSGVPAACTNLAASPTDKLFLCSLPAVAAGATATLDIDVLPHTAGGDIQSDLTITGFTGPADPHPGNDGASETTPIVDGGPTLADLSIGVTDDPDPVEVGQLLDYEVTVENAGAEVTDAQIGLLVFDLNLLESTVPTGCSTLLASDHYILTCTIASLPQGALETLAFQVRPGTVQSLSATAEIAGWTGPGDTEAADNTANETTQVTASTGEADLAVEMLVGPDPVVEGGTIQNDVTLTNDGPATVTDADVLFSIDDPVSIEAPDIPDGCTLQPSVNSIFLLCRAAVLGPGDSETWNIDVTAGTAPATVTSSATVQGAVGASDPNSSNDMVTETTDIVPAAEADLRVAFSGVPTSLTVGDPLGFSVDYGNDGPDPTDQVEIVVDLSSTDLTPSVVPPACTQLAVPDVTVYGCDIGALGSGAGASLGFEFTTGAVETIDLGVEIRTRNGCCSTDPDASDNTDAASTVVGAAPEADLRVAFSGMPTTLTVGDPLGFSLDYGNDGPDPADPVTISVGLGSTDLTPTVVPAGCTRLAVPDETVYGCDVGPLASGAGASLAFEFTTGAAETIDSNVEIFSDGSTSDPDPGDNTDLASTVVEAVSGFTGTVAFTSDRDGSEDIYVKDLASGAVTQVTNDDLDEFAVSLSPDGTRIAFRRENGSFLNWFDIWVINIDGTGLTQLTSSGDAGSLNWSPDGTEIAFNDSRDGDWEIYVLEVANPGNVRKLTDNDTQELAPDWSPDGSQITYYRAALSFGDDQLRTMSSSDGSGDALLVSEPDINSPAWSPDGTEIAYTRQVASTGEREIKAANVSTAAIRTILSDGHANSGPRWSPDGTSIVFAKNGLDPDLSTDVYDLYVVASDGLSAATELEASSGDDVGPDWR